ncbi:MAG: sugar kinase [Dongiaceae bacterium]
MIRVASIGECMIELSPRPGGLLGLGFGGDTLNTAVYLARLGVAVDYLTALGDDPYSDRMLALWREEGVGTELVTRLPGRLPGLYMIEIDPQGERRFRYWRDRAPARELFQREESENVIAALPGYHLIYLSGISLSLYGEFGRKVLFTALDRARAAGARIAFDSNYRPRNWPDIATARAAMAAMLARTDIVLSSHDDERLLQDDGDPAACARRLHGAGPGEVVLKQGALPCRIVTAEGELEVAAERVDRVVDTTAAGDSFNAGYLAARLAGRPPREAARAGHRLAAAVVGHVGALIPRAAMPVPVEA